MQQAGEKTTDMIVATSDVWPHELMIADMQLGHDGFTWQVTFNTPILTDKPIRLMATIKLVTP